MIEGLIKSPFQELDGIAVIAGFLVAAIYLVITMCVEHKLNLHDTDNYGKKLLGFLIGIIIIACFAYMDDVKDLRPWQKLIVQIIAAAVVYQFGIKIDTINGTVLPTWFSAVLTIGWIVGITNAINLIDGLDGLSSGITLISCISLLIIFATNYSPVISIVLITALAGAIMGFLPYNINPAKTFIGDVGAQFLGFSLSVISILGVAKTVTLVVLVAPVLVLGLPIFDTLFAIVRRIIKGKSLKAVFKADKGHLHHRLMALGFTQKQSVAILYAASATLGMLAIILIDDGLWKAVSFIAVVAVIVAIGFKELNKYRKDLIEENKKLGLVDPKDLKDNQTEKAEEKVNKIEESKE
jgi:UDP-GlcNAc:undecaprenyl-phosphate GlcNAc-1-phosphate transferase